MHKRFMNIVIDFARQHNINLFDIYYNNNVLFDYYITFMILTLINKSFSIESMKKFKKILTNNN